MPPEVSPIPCGSSAPRLSVSIVIACRNEAASITNFLHSLLRQDFTGMDWEVIVADGMSTDGTRNILEEFQPLRPHLRVIPNPGKIVSTGLNAAIREARGEIILRMDAHTEYAPDYVRRCVDTLLQSDAENVGGPARTVSEGFWGRAIAAGYASKFSCGGARFHNVSYEGYVDTVTYGCWRKQTLVELGLFDEHLIRNQDDELNLRLVRRGGRIWQTPAIVSWYHPRSTLSRLFAQYAQYGFWKVAVIRKHRIPASWRHLIPALFVLANLLFVCGAAALRGPVRWFEIAAWLGMLAAYLVATALASLSAARRHGWDLLPAFPLVFATYHLSYGSGFLCGLVYWPMSSLGLIEQPTAFSELTR